MSRSPERTEMDDSACLDLSLKQIWLVVHFEGSDPGKELEIVNQNQLVPDSWNHLKKGAKVVVAYGNAKVQGSIVTMSDDRQYLNDNFKRISEEFMQSERKPPQRVRLKQNIIKVMDRQTQTENGYTDFLELEKKYHGLKKELKKTKSLLKGVKSGVLAALSGIDDKDSDDERRSPGRVLTTLKQEKDDGRRSPGRVLTTLKQENIVCSSNGENEFDTICIGPGKTRVSASTYKSINWNNHSVATRKLLVSLFSRSVLATHSLTGKPSPAFGDKEAKMRLDPTIVGDIVDVVSKKCKVSESLVRSAITTKCADENKMLKRRTAKANATA